MRLGRRHNSISPFALHLKPTICEITAMALSGFRTDTFRGVLGVMKLLKAGNVSHQHFCEDFLSFGFSTKYAIGDLLEMFLFKL